MPRSLAKEAVPSRVSTISSTQEQLAPRSTRRGSASLRTTSSTAKSYLLIRIQQVEQAVEHILYRLEQALVAAQIHELEELRIRATA